MTEDAGRPEALDQALERLRLEGAIFLRAEYSESWTLEGQGGPMFAPGGGASRAVPRHRLGAVLGGASGRRALLGERRRGDRPAVRRRVPDGRRQGGDTSASARRPHAAVDRMPVVRMAVAGSRTWCADASFRGPLFDPGDAFPGVRGLGRRTARRRCLTQHCLRTGRIVAHGHADQQSSPSCSSPKRSGCTSRRPPPWSAAGSLGYAIPCSDPRWPRSTQLRNEDGRSTTLLPRPGCHARGSTLASASATAILTR